MSVETDEDETVVLDVAPGETTVGADLNTTEPTEMRTVCCTARTVTVDRKGQTYLECEDCGRSSPKRERVPLSEAQAAYEARQ